MTDDELTLRYFGERWEASMLDDAVQAPTPVGELCVSCREAFVDGDRGLIFATGLRQHRECGLRGVLGGIGHIVNHAHYCHGELGPDAGLSYRTSALMVWLHFAEGRRFTEDDLDWAREVPNVP